MNRKNIVIIAASVLVLGAAVGWIVWLRGRNVEPSTVRTIPAEPGTTSTATPVTGIPLTPSVDTDSDQLSDEDEVRIGTDPNNPDTDGDGFTDFFEVDAGTDPLSATSAPRQQVRSEAVFRELYGNGEEDSSPSPTPSQPPPASADPDNDGLTTIQEEQIGTDPNNPDTDGDGFNDGDEVQAGYNPLGPGRLQ